jgi:hypothetical protein
MIQLHTIERGSRQILQFEARSTDRKKVLSPYARPFVHSQGSYELAWNSGIRT